MPALLVLSQKGYQPALSLLGVKRLCASAATAAGASSKPVSATPGEKMDHPVYHGNINREVGEKLLSRSGKDGSYLIRDSESMPGVYCLCVLCSGLVYTYRVFKTSTDSWTVETAPGVNRRLFRKVKNLISAYQKEDQGLAVPLLYPVYRQKGTVKDEDYQMMLPSE
ncbi:SH2 domain-containing protein 1A-like [Pristis pectinata]|uniref:SH2 domain-containing protein 1A-like n=1 Tax=Pristis pectinata TaxID=685728 RepID=UPI00223CD856|nr:SH2 domain-containing protein 1A-like [Pristis pectinata]